MRAVIVIALVGASAAQAGGGAGRVVLPQVTAAIQLDGELDETAWRSSARSGAFVDVRGESAAPYSDARFLRDDHALYLALYAADEDVRASDAFVVELGSSDNHVTWRFTAGGKMSPAIADAHTAVDIDGTVDSPGDDDEEWVVEAAVPLSAVPFARDGTVAVRVSRCDTTKDRIERCGAWKGILVRR